MPCDTYENSTGKLKLVNGGNRPVWLRHARYSCDCLPGKSPQGAAPPGGSADVEIMLSPNGQGGQLRQKVWLEFEWDRKAEAVENPQGIASEKDDLILSNQVQVEVQVLLLSRLRLGMDVATLDFNNDDAAASRTVQLTGSAREVVITEVKQPFKSQFRYELSEGGRSLTIMAIYDRRSPKRNVMENWTLMTSDEEVKQLSLSLNLHVKHDFIVIPDVIELNPNGKLPLKGTLLVKSVNPRKRVKVSRAVWENAEGKVEIKELPHGLTRIAYSMGSINRENASLVIFTTSHLQSETAVSIK